MSAERTRAVARRCGRIDAHPPHDWSAPREPGYPLRIYHCEGTWGWEVAR